MTKIIFCFLLAIAGSQAQELHLTWSRTLPERQPIWNWNNGMAKDPSYRFVVAGDLVLVGIPADGSLLAVDRASGAERWRWYADGPIRHWPTVVGDTAVVGSQDGTVACLALADGRLRWRYRPGPGDRWCIAHDQMISLWPIATDLAVADGTVFGICGTFRDEGAWTFAVDAATGAERWLHWYDVPTLKGLGRAVAGDGQVGFGPGPGGGPVRDLFRVSDGQRLKIDPKQPVLKAAPLEGTAIPALVRIAPGVFREGVDEPVIDLEKALAAGAVQKLSAPSTWVIHGPLPIVPGRSMDPAAWGPGRALTMVDGRIDLVDISGKDQHPARIVRMDQEVLLTSVIDLAEAGDLVVNLGADWHLRATIAGEVVANTLASGNLSKPTALGQHGGRLALAAGRHPITVLLRPGREGWALQVALARCPAGASADLPGRFPGRLRGADLDDPTEAEGKVIQAHRDGNSLLLLTSAGRLHVLITRSSIATKAVEHAEPPITTRPGTLADLPGDGGWVLVAGLADGALVEDLAAQNRWFRIVAADADPARVDAVRRRLGRAGLLAGGRVQVMQVDPAAPDLPPWFASLVLSERADLDWSVLARFVRPYGGRLLLSPGAAPRLPAGADLRPAVVAGRPCLERPDGAAQTEEWREERSDPSNRNCTVEPLVRFPLSPLWYGGESCDQRNYQVWDPVVHWGVASLPANLLVARGQWILQGLRDIVAIDQYTGRKRWSAPIPEYYPMTCLGIHAMKEAGDNREPWKVPAALKKPIQPADHPRSGGFNGACDDERYYLAGGPHLISYDLATGAVAARWEVPAALGQGLRWGTVRVAGDLLICSFFHPDDLVAAQMGWDGNGGSWVKDRHRMRHLAAIARSDGSLRWRVTAARGYLNAGFAIGGGRLYALDLLAPNIATRLLSAGAVTREQAVGGTINGFALADGSTLWSRPLDAMLCDLAYDAGRDRVVLASRYDERAQSDGDWVSVHGRTLGPNSPGRLTVLSGATGAVVTEATAVSYAEPLNLNDRFYVTRKGMMIDPESGALARRPHPLTGAPATMSLIKSGCVYLVGNNQVTASRGYWNDLDAWLSGSWVFQDLGCQPSALPAGGLLNITNDTIMRFNNRRGGTAMAMVHRDRVTYWAGDDQLGRISASAAWVRRLGVVPGAPGNRPDPLGSWWLHTNADGVLPLAAPKARPAGAATTGGIYDIAEHRLVWAQPQTDIPAWVGCFGLVDPGTLRIPLVVPAGKVDGPVPEYRVRLIVAEPAAAPGQRIFSVLCNGRTVVADLDVAAAAGRARPIVREWTCGGSDRELSITYQPAAGSALPPISGNLLITRVEP